ncbi:hypothetical protein HPP92_000784 [Vanilla planifolia]|uniref:G protein gamma domain-containing protein n=1 Tax=Vanilla planifolia TaxID=51239 RepID=A0A835VEW1_VANPL|nr:hypothetical protein HPP92_000928 [Vanilla planifolia]KAG0500712.1 hypothetical protein HPP92_000784 [Vanilla planifolia]
MQASGECTVSFPLLSADTRGKHRILAELKNMEQEARCFEEELNELEKIEKASTTLQELLQKIGNSSDPLLPVSRGPANPSWDRWFEGPQELHGCKCWAL